MFKFIRNNSLYFAWLIACTSTLCSLYYSYILNVEPCVLCYFQRICLFPLSIMLGIATFRNDSSIKIYTLPLVLIGMATAIYQVCLQEIPGMTLDICGKTSCATKLFVFGFITMPMASAVAFCAIACLLVIAPKQRKFF